MKKIIAIATLVAATSASAGFLSPIYLYLITYILSLLLFTKFPKHHAKLSCF